MALPRNSITDFEVANAPYALAEVSVHIANPDGSKGALATLYSGLAGVQTLSNPQTLDNTGKWQQPVYIDTDYILSIDSPLDPLLDHDTGVVRYGGGWRGDYVGGGTRYNIDDRILGPSGEAEESNVYRSQSIWTSTDWATDVADPTNMVLEMDYQALRALALSAVPDASESQKGVIEIATQAETNAGADDTRAITPLKLQSRQATESLKGIAEVATQAETNTGANDTHIVTPSKLHARAASESLTGIIAIATTGEAQGGSDDAKAMTPVKTKAAIESVAHSYALTQTFNNAVVINQNGVDTLSLQGTTSIGIQLRATSAADDSEIFQIVDTGGDLIFRSRNNDGSSKVTAVTMASGGGITVGAPAGGNKGVGTINAQGDVYKNNSAYTNPDYVFEYVFRGHVEKFADNPGAKEYRGPMALDELETYVQENLRLPGISDDPMGAFERSDKVLEKLEEMTLYIIDLHKRLKALGG